MPDQIHPRRGGPVSGGDHNQGEGRKTGVPLLDGAEWVDPDEHGPDCGCAGCYLTHHVDRPQ